MKIPRDEVTLDCELPHPPAKVWRALTEPALLARWLTTPDIDAECEIIDAELHRLLRLNWRAEKDGETIDTVVTFTLTETETGTHLHLVHDGFPASQPVAMLAGTNVVPLAPRRLRARRITSMCEIRSGLGKAA